ncbi:MAG: cytochrome P450 [Solirubrobacterales bacterium]|nr:cytochrome P450 [Solirubrobacterales bacterium]
MSLVGPPPPATTNPLVRVATDLRIERELPVPFPPGHTRLSPTRSFRFIREPLPVLLEAYGRFGPVFTLRVFHQNVVFVLGPEANHHLLVSGAQNFSWREGHMGDLMPLLGDGLLTVDGPFHRSSRKIMLPAFHQDRIRASHATMHEETARGLTELGPGTHDLYAWTREVALRIAMRALFGLDPDRPGEQIDAGAEFERALSFYSRDYPVQMLRGPRTPFSRMQAARRRLDAVIFGEIERRAGLPDPGEDLLGLLLAARDEDGGALSREHVRDEVITLLFAGHDTTTSTIAFLLHELAKAPELQELAAGSPEELDLAVDETLRLYPPAWVGPRRSIAPFEVCGVPVPGGVPVNYVSWASHRLPDVWEEPERFDPQRFAPGRREQIPRGAYVPFGDGSRKCIGMRFGQAEIAVIARALLERYRFAPVPGHAIRIRQMPTLTPRDGMPLRLTTRG